MVSKLCCSGNRRDLHGANRPEQVFKLLGIQLKGPPSMGAGLGRGKLIVTCSLCLSKTPCLLINNFWWKTLCGQCVYKRFLEQTFSSKYCIFFSQHRSWRPSEAISSFSLKSLAHNTKSQPRKWKIYRRLADTCHRACFCFYLIDATKPLDP